jgi:hypothetical protein
LKVGYSANTNPKRIIILPDSLNKSALITGASSGLGAEFANQLAAEGYDLILVARREERLQQLADSIKSTYGIKTTILPADLSVHTDIERIIEVIRNSTNIEILVNNAGFGITKRFLKAELQLELAQMEVMMIAPVLLCRAVLPAMVSQNKGEIINVSSLAGLIPIRSILYGSSKAFLINFSIALQDELRATNVKVQALSPGFVVTEFHETPEYTNFDRKNIPAFLWMTSKEVVAESIKSLQSDKVICVPGNFYRLVGFFAQNSITAGMIKFIARLVLSRKKLKFLTKHGA